MELFVVSSLWMFLSSWEFLKFVTNSVQYFGKGWLKLWYEYIISTGYYVCNENLRPIKGTVSTGIENSVPLMTIT